MRLCILSTDVIAHLEIENFPLVMDSAKFLSTPA